jgi:hypothetical protein
MKFFDAVATHSLTRPVRAILDCADEGTDRALLEQAFREGLKRGLITQVEIKHVQAAENSPAWMKELLKDRA